MDKISYLQLFIREIRVQASGPVPSKNIYEKSFMARNMNRIDNFALVFSRNSELI